jgi:NAD(P)-dependent dehydrogenase (short-subunit alcohol dehydrogenase family)
MDFAGKNIFVFGGTNGINLGVAESFAQAGATVGVASRKSDKVKAAHAQIAGHGGAAFGAVADVRNPDEVAAALQQFVDAHGPVDVLVSGAAGNFPAAAATLSPNGFRTVVEIDLFGTFHVMRAAYPHLCKPGASLINISAPQAMFAMAGQLHVCAAKAGIDMITRTLAIEWGPEGVRVNSVVPGPIDGTEGMARLTPDKASRASLTRQVPLRRYGTTDDVAQLCLFLASDAAAYISGAIIPVDGGWTANGAHMEFGG